MSISSIQAKYPSAVWFDSAHTGTESGSVTEPYNTIGEAMTAASSGGVIAIKDGTHNVTQITMGKSLTFVGESTSAVLSTSGTTYGGAINANGTSHSIKLETLKLYHNLTSSSNYSFGIITAGNTSSATVTVEGCIIEMGANTIASGSRGTFTGHSSPVTSLTVSDSVFIVASGRFDFGILISGNFNQDGFNALDFQRNTVVVAGGLGTKFFISPSGLTNSTIKNNIMVGAGNSETIGITPGTLTYNCFHNNSVTSGGSNNLFSTDPQFVDSANGDYRLRPSSPCIGAGTAS
jgi:hypothetical protein